MRRVAAGLGALMVAAGCYAVAHETLASRREYQALNLNRHGKTQKHGTPASEGMGAQTEARRALVQATMARYLKWKRQGPWLLAGGVALFVVLAPLALPPMRPRAKKYSTAGTWLADPANRIRVTVTAGIAALLAGGCWWVVH